MVSNTHSNAKISNDIEENTDLECGVAVRTGISDFNITSIDVIFEAIRIKLKIN